MDTDLQYKDKFRLQLMIMLGFIMVMWAVKLFEIYVGVSLGKYGIEPGTISGLRGIFFMPFLHEDFGHLISNSIPILILGVSSLNFYGKHALTVMASIILIGGLLLWFIGRPSYHIGASGLVYGLAFFLFAGGIVRRERAAIALSLLVAFLYGSVFWGIFPIIPQHSWEGHLSGAVVGMVMAFVFRKVNPRPKYQWELEEEQDEQETEL